MCGNYFTFTSLKWLKICLKCKNGISVASRHNDSPVRLAPVVLHLAAVLEVLEVVVLVLEEDPELALLLLDLGHGLQHHLVSIAVRRQWILIMESSLKTVRDPKF